MRGFVFISSFLAVPWAAFACGGNSECSCSGDHHEKSAHADADPSACARKAELVGGACSYSTGIMAQKVLADGNSWTYTGSLTKTGTSLESHVAAPYTVGPDSVYVIANQVLESLTTDGGDQKRVALEGKMLEVDGVKYFVLTSFEDSVS